MDRRIKKTEQAFMTALLHFLTEKDLKQITVKELCDYADINRSTFYLHYYDIYDLMDKTEQKMVDAIYTPINTDSQEILHDILDTFEYLKEHKSEYRAVFNVNMGSGFIQKLTRKIIDQRLMQIKEIIPNCTDEVAHSAALILVGGATALLYDWIVFNDCRIPPKTILQAVSDMTDYMYRKKLSTFGSKDLHIENNRDPS